MIKRLTHEDENDNCLCCGGKKKDIDDDNEKEDDEKKSKLVDEEQPEPPLPPPPPPPQVSQATQTADAGVVALAAAPELYYSAPMPQVVIPYTPDDASQASTTIHPSNVSVVTMPVFRTVSIHDGDMFFDAGDDANSV